MVTLLTGANSFELQHILRQRIDGFVREHGDLALERLTGSEVEVARISEALSSMPFLALKKLVVLESPSGNKQYLEQFETLLAGASESTDVVVVEPTLDKRTQYYKWLVGNTDFQDCKVLDERGLASWAVSFAKQQGSSLKQGDAAYLIARVGLNQQQLAHELEKLALLGDVTRQTIDELTERSPQSTVFELLDAAFSGRTAAAIALYEQQRQARVEPQQIIAMLVWQLHLLALVKSAGQRSSADIARSAKVSPFSVTKTMKIAAHLPLSRLKELVARLVSIDQQSKRSMLDLDDALQAYVLSLATDAR